MHEAAPALAASGLFDANYYLLNGPDVAEAGVDPLAHFCRHGWREDRRPNPYFEPLWYCRVHAVPQGVNPLLHYIAVGEAQLCRPGAYFDPAWYAAAHRLPAGVSPLRHFLAHRRDQRHSPNPGFDAVFYCDRYRDEVRPGRDPFQHYLAIGAPRGLHPAPWFDPAAYRRAQLAAGANAAELTDPLRHFLDRYPGSTAPSTRA